MKAHVRTLPSVALLWNIPTTSPEFELLQRVCGPLGIAVKPVEPHQAGATTGWLAGIPGASEAALLLHLQPDAYPAALVLSGLSGPVLDSLLAQLRAGGAAIPLKAVVTPTSQNWPFCELLAELVRERKALEKGQ